MTDVELHERVRGYVTGALRAPDLGDADDIFDVGGASSLFAAELVLFVEETLGAELDDSDLVRENFATIDAVTALVERRRAR